MWGWNPFHNWWKPSNYTTWYWYILIAPIMGLILFYAIIGNSLYSLFRRR